MHEVMAGRLFTTRHNMFTPSDLVGRTLVVNLSSDVDLVALSYGHMVMAWPMEEDVEERVFEGLIRMCSSVMKGKEQSVLLIGHQDTVDVVASCIIREHLGCKPEIAIGIVRENRRNCMNKSELLETIFKYKIS